MTDQETVDDLIGSVFIDAERWADMDTWYSDVDRIRAERPVARVERAGFTPFWALTRHSDIWDVSRDNDRFWNTSNVVLGRDEDRERALAAGMPEPASLVQLDGAKHRSHRAVTANWFKAGTIAARKDQVDAIADEFIARMREMGGRCDFAADIAQPYTLRAIMNIYGVPREDEELMLRLTQGVFGAADPEFMGDHDDPLEAVVASIMDFIGYFDAMTENRRRCPADDLATVIANAEVDGAPMGDYERLWYYIIVATAGHDTTSFALSGGMEQLVRDPEQLRALAADPSLVNNAADECVRWSTPVRHFLRYAQEDATVGGVEIPAGDRVLLSYPAANRDPDVFTDPHTFDITRADASRLLSFGVGAHFCLGVHFARMELRAMLERLAAQLEHIELAGEPEWARANFVSGVKHLPVAYRFAD